MKRLFVLWLGGLSALAFCATVHADGKVMPPRDYKGSLEEKAQEAIIIFQGGDEKRSAVEDLILKIQVVGEAERFAWIIPFPTAPKVSPADPQLFAEVFQYVESRLAANRKRSPGAKFDKSDSKKSAADVRVISRQIVGDYEVTIVKEEKEGGLNPWLDDNGYQTLDDAEDILDFYRNKNYVYACIKFDSAALKSKRVMDSHPLRFEFTTGGRDGIYFPMKLTSLQTAPFDVNLYVFYRYWLNDSRSKYGFEHRGFQLRFRDYDSSDCTPNAGKAYSLPQQDPYLKPFARRLPTLTRLFQTLHPGERYYLTNIQAYRLKPQTVRQWKDDLWLFPYYTDRQTSPYDVLPDGPASLAYPVSRNERLYVPNETTPGRRIIWFAGIGGGLIALLAVVGFLRIRFRRPPDKTGKPSL